MTAKIPGFVVLFFTAFILTQTSFETSFAQEQSQVSETNHPLRNDPTGINWVFSLEEAFQKARETDRIVMLKPVSFRSEATSDRLCPASEAQRALAFVDSRVVNMINRRFVPYYFDMDKAGYLYDAEAAELTLDLFPDIRFSSMPTPPLMFVTPEKKLLKHGSNFLTADELLELMVEILTDNPTYMELTTAERVVTDPVKRAWVYYELRDLDKAVAALDKQQSSEAYYLRVLLARETENWPAMKKAIDMVTDRNRKLDIDVENIRRYWTLQNLEGILAKGKTVSKENPRYQEAMYYVGLAQYHLDAKEQAITTWQNAIRHQPGSAWALRLDLALGLLQLDPNAYLSAQDKIPSELGRNYMCPNGLFDLSRRN